MKILISGSSGLIGSALQNHFEEDHDLFRLERNRPVQEDTEIYWNPSNGEMDASRLTGFDTVIHLAGEPIVGRWSSSKKERILNSRKEGTRMLSEALAEVDQPPELLVSASAIGYYGDRGDEVLDESAGPGNLFLSSVCQEWEEATEPAAEAGIRVVNTRFGVVLSTKGGALAQMLFPFYLGLGGPIGDGEQWMSWISITDVVYAIEHVMKTEEVEGPVNVVAPNPVRNKKFTNAMGDVLGRWTPFPLPAFAARLLFGEMADELLLASTRVRPKKLRESGFEFRHSQIRDGLLNVIQHEK